MSSVEQSLKNHTRTDIAYHFVLVPVFCLNLIFLAIHCFRHPNWFDGWLMLFSAALLLHVFKTRLYALKVQDRVIRLEERLRLSNLAPEALRPRIPDLTTPQLIALRFASDDELPALAAQALDEHLSARQIKKRIASWRPDYFRV